MGEYSAWTCLEQESLEKQERLEKLYQQQTHVKTYLKALQADPKLLERLARERLNYSKKGELVFRFLEFRASEANSSPSTR